MKSTGFTKILFSAAYFAYSCVYLCRMSLSVAQPVLEAQNVLTKSEYGIIGSAFFIAYALGQLINGNLGDKIKPAIMVSCGLFVSGICCIAIGLLPPFIYIAILWGVNGYTQSMIWGPLLRTVSMVFAEKQKQSIAAFLVSSVGVGSVLGILLAAFCISNFGVKVAFIVPGILSCLASVVTAFCIKGKEAQPKQKRISLSKMLKNKNLRRALLPAAIHGVLKDNIVMWTPVFFVQKYGVDIKAMAFFALLVPVVGLVGRLAYPFIFKAAGQNENKVSVLSFIFCAVLLVPICFGAAPVWLACVILCGVCGAISVINTSLISVYPMKFENIGNVSSVSGLMDFATYVGAGVSSVLYGYVLQNGNFEIMFLSWVILSIIATIAFYKKDKVKKIC